MTILPTFPGSKFLIGSSLASETPDLTSMDSTSIMCEKSIESQHQQHQQFNNNIVNGCCPTVVPQLNSHMVNIGGGNGQTVELPNGPESHI